MVRPLALLTACLALGSVSRAHEHGDHAHHPVAERARELLAAFPEPAAPDPRAVLRAADDEQRLRVDFFPLLTRADQSGALLADMSLEQARATHALLGEVLSDAGVLRVHAIRSLEDVLRAVEGDRRDSIRRPGAYTVRLFGDPRAEAPWTFELEGHHLAVHATLVDGVFRGTPLFLGSNPAEVRGGAFAGLRVLADQEDLARALVTSLSEAQRARAITGPFTAAAALAPGPLGPPAEPRGLAASELDEAQRALLLATVASYAANLRADFAAEELERVRAAGLERLWFEWRGGTRAGEPCSYRIQGPTVLVRFDLLEDRPGAGANHVHSLWSDPERDFGADLLERHYAEDHGK